MEDAQQLRDDFVVRIGPGPDGLMVQVMESPEGQSPPVPFRNPFSEDDLRELERRFAETGGSPGPRDGGGWRNLRPLEPPDETGWAESAGETLFRALLPEPLLELWRMSLRDVTRHEDPRRRLLLRVRFDLAEAGRATAAGGELLHRLPWELLRDPERGRFLVDDDRCSVARYLEVARPSSRDPASGPLVVLAAGASPRGDPTPFLDLASEVDHLEAALGDAVELRRLENATLETLRRELRRKTVHVLHFMGHGDFDRATGEGLLMLEDRVGCVAPVGSRALLGAIGGALAGTRLVVLNACRTAETAASAPWTGLATALVGQGVGAVVAMNHPITDRAALAFSWGFYGHLADGGEIDSAVREGRREIRRASPRSAEWAIPALFLRSSGGPLVRAAPSWRRLWIGAVVAIALVSLVSWIGFETHEGGGAPDVVEAVSGAVHRLPLGEPVPLPEAGAVVSAEIITPFGREMVRLTVAPDGGGTARKAVFPGESAVFPLPLEGGSGEPDESLEIQVLTLDRAERAVAVRALRRLAKG